MFGLSKPIASFTAISAHGTPEISAISVSQLDMIGILGGSIILVVLLYLYLKGRRDLNYYQQKARVNQDEILQKFYDNTPVMMQSIDMEGRLIYVNDYWLQSLGYEKDEVIGEKSSSFFYGRLKNNYAEMFDQLLNNGVIRECEAQIQKKDGSTIDVSLTAELIYDSKGRPIRSFTIMMDITERRRAENQLLEGKHKLDSILNNAVEAIFVLQNARIQYANPATVDVLGHSPEDLHQFPFHKILYEEDREWVVNNYQKRMQGEKVPQQYSFRVVQKNGEVIWVEINAVYLLWDNKPAILIFLIDITERKKHDDTLIEQARVLQEKNQMQNKLNQQLREKNKELDEHQSELEDYADELQAALEEVAVKNRRIEEAHSDMMDSIEYARLIQEAVLKTSEDLNGFFEHFILFKPKDIVSGDFYYFKKINNTYVFALGDCTGHGVPGGFLTMLSVNLLQEVIIRSDVYNLVDIMEKLRHKMKNVFHHSRHHDGMDLALCVYDKDNQQLYFSGANLSAMIISKGKPHVFKPVHNPIGYYIQEFEFETQQYKVSPDDTLYLYSDGFKDQFGGQKNKKYQFKRFQELMVNLHVKPLWEQKQLLFNEHTKWKRKEPQLDDITVIGIRL